jgi:dTDP-4-dehydrorhamnose reductase
MKKAGRIQPEELTALHGRTVVITGAGGMLGSAFAEALATAAPACRVVAMDHQRLDVTNAEAVRELWREHPEVIIHCAADVNADRCERQPRICDAVQVGGTINVIDLALATGAQVVYPQSVFIYDGSELPVTESTIPAPMSAYGRAKLEAERRLLDALPGSLVVRIAGFFGGDARDKNFVGSFTRALLRDGAQGLAARRVGTRVWQPTYTRDVAENILLLLANQATGIYNMGAYGEATFAEVARACVAGLGFDDFIVIEDAPGLHAAHEIAPRPFRMVTDNQRLAREGLDRQRHWRDALQEYLSRPFFQHQAQLMLQSRG